MTQMMIKSPRSGTPLIMQFTTTAPNTVIALPLAELSEVDSSPMVYNFEVDWGDGNTGNVTSYDDPDASHTYTDAGTYTVTITGTCEKIRFNNVPPAVYLDDITQWGDIGLKDLYAAFYGCVNLTNITATDAPNLENVTSLRSAFYGCNNLIDGVEDWDVSTITSMRNMFLNCVDFDCDLSTWDVSNVTDMAYMFYGCTYFDQNVDVGLDAWNVGNVQNMNSMFFGTNYFNQNISGWNTSNVTDMGYMFYSAASFSQDVGNWDISGVTVMTGMFALVGNFGTANYDLLLNGWAAQSVQSSVTLDVNTQYTIATSQTARNTLTGAPNNWTINDNGGI